MLLWRREDEGKGKQAYLAEDVEVGLVGGERKHDEVGIQAIDDVLCVWVGARASALLADVLHHLVLSLPRRVGVGEDDLQGMHVPGNRTGARVRRDWIGKWLN